MAIHVDVVNALVEVHFLRDQDSGLLLSWASSNNTMIVALPATRCGSVCIRDRYNQTTDAEQRDDLLLPYGQYRIPVIEGGIDEDRGR